MRAICCKGDDTALSACRYLRQTIEQSSPAQLNALMKFLQPHEEISGRSGSVGSSVSKPTSPAADDKAEEVRARTLQFDANFLLE